MSRYTIGDRVEVYTEVRLEGESFTAVVINVHEAEGACDVAYEIDDSVAVFLTAEKHGLQLLPEVYVVMDRALALHKRRRTRTHLNRVARQSLDEGQELTMRTAVVTLSFFYFQ